MTLRATARARRALRDDEDGAAMITALMLIMVVGTLSILVLGTLVSQVRPASLLQKTTRTVFAAEAGTQAVLGELRTAVAATGSDGVVYGDPSLLPCSLSGAVGEPSAQLSYVAAVQYFAADPSTLTTAQRASAALACGTTGGGRGVAVAPGYAVITSQGLAAGVPGLATTSGDRTLETQYAFRVTNTNVAGGLFRNSDFSFCLAADQAAAGSLVTYASCSTRTTTNLWVHDENSYVVLASTASGGSPLCLEGPQSSSDDRVRLAACAVKGAQLLSYKGYFRYEGQNDANTAPGGRCLWAGSKTTALAGLPVRVASGGCASGSGTQVARPWWSWNPEPAVGAGSASAAGSQQLINYAEFGRCLEVTQENLNADNMGIGPCKQNLPGNSNRWNQVWTSQTPASGSSSVQTVLSVDNPSDKAGKRCLSTPAAKTSPAYPTLAVCTGASAQQWTRTTATSDYATSYLLVDRFGRCLGGGDLYYPDGSALTSVVAEPCTGEGDQKWNAPASTTPSGQSHTSEGS